jgi:predicted RNase H-like nuclease (RuvC/YqgF family)
MGKVKEIEDPTLREKLAKLTDEQKSLQGQCETLNGQVAELRRALDSQSSDPSIRSRGELERDIEKARENKTALEAQLAALQNPSDPNSRGCPVYEKILSGKRSRYVLLYRGHVAPIEPPYYEFSNVSFGNLVISRQEAKRVKEGDPVARAIESGGSLDTLCKNLDTSRDLVVLDVCTDSIAAFRVVVEYLGKHKIPYTWEPEEDKTFTFSPWGSSPVWVPGTGR